MSSESSKCNICNTVLEDGMPLEVHNRMRAHINHLLRNGVEIDVDDDNPVLADCEMADVKLPAMPLCFVCKTSVGTSPTEAAKHFRSREHINERLKQGLPVNSLSTSTTGVVQQREEEERAYINQCLRQGILPPTQQGSAVLPSVRPAISAKRKLPVATPVGQQVSLFAGGTQQKRPCLPSAPNAPKPIPSRLSSAVTPAARPFSVPRLGAGVGNKHMRPAGVTVARTAGLRGMRMTSPSPSNLWNSAANQSSIPCNAGLLNENFDEQFMDDYDTLDYTGEDGSIYYDDDSSNAGLPGYNNSGGQSVYGEPLAGDSGWFCDLCNIPLLTTHALGQHLTSAEHRAATEWSRSQGHGLAMMHV